MLTDYIRAAMEKARYEILEDGTYYGEIPGFQGVFSNDAKLDSCRQQLQEVLESWMILGIHLGHRLPVINGINLNIRGPQELKRELKSELKKAA